MRPIPGEQRRNDRFIANVVWAAASMRARASAAECVSQKHCSLSVSQLAILPDPYVNSLLPIVETRVFLPGYTHVHRNIIFINQYIPFIEIKKRSYEMYMLAILFSCSRREKKKRARKEECKISNRSVYLRQEALDRNHLLPLLRYGLMRQIAIDGITFLA